MSDLSVDKEKELEMLHKVKGYKKINSTYDVENNQIQLKLILQDCAMSPCYNIEGNVLLLSDRLYGIALGLQYFFVNHTKATVLDIADNYETALMAVQKRNIDLLIIAGYQKSRSNYKIIDYLEKRGRTRTVMWAVLDKYIDTICYQYHINYKFERTEPLSLFADYLIRNHLLECEK